MTDLRFLEVPFDDKDIVKKLGAKWHSKRRKWFIPEGVDTAQFAKWEPEYDTTFNVRAIAPFFLIESFETCFRCGTNAPVVSFGAANFEEILEGDDAETSLDQESDSSKEPVMFSYVSTMPERLTKFVEEKFPTFFMDWSNTTESFYFMNHCTKCSAKLGDFYLHSEPEHAFFPQTPEDVKPMKVTELKSTGGVLLGASPSWGSMGYILEHTKVEKYESAS